MATDSCPGSSRVKMNCDLQENTNYSNQNIMNRESGVVNFKDLTEIEKLKLDLKRQGFKSFSILFIQKFD